MKPSFWQLKNKRFLTFKPTSTDDNAEKRHALLNHATNIRINGATLLELMIYHAGLNPQDLSQKEIEAYLKENMKFSTIVAIFQGFLFHNLPKNLKHVYSETISPLLYQEGLMFSASHALLETFIKEGYLLKLSDIKTKINLVTTDDEKLYIEEHCQLHTLGTKNSLSEDGSVLMTVENRFHLKPLINEAGEQSLQWQQDECLIQLSDAAIENRFDKKNFLEKIGNFINAALQKQVAKDGVETMGHDPRP